NVNSPDSKSAQTPRITHGPCGASSPTPSSSINARLPRSFQTPTCTTSIRYDPVTIRLLFRAPSSWVHGLLAFVSLDSREELQDSLIVELDALEDFLQFVGNLANRRGHLQGLEPGDGIEDQTVLVLEMVHHDLQFLLGLQVDLVVVLRHETVFFRLPVLAHHHDRTRVRGLKAQHQVEQDEGVGIPRLDRPGVLDLGEDQINVDRDPEQENGALDQDEGPAADHQRDPVRDALTEAELLFVLGDDVSDRRMIMLVVGARTEAAGALWH